jgi:hypothetical protein
MIRKLTILIFVILFAVLLHGQEVLTGLQVNPAVRQAALENGQHYFKNDIQLVLPFFDDFSGDGIFPSSNRWIDRDVFINNDYPVFPITAGVATFDAIDETGMLYPNASDNRFRADYLTSQSIRLDSIFSPEPRALTTADSIYLSFYFQPEGLGFAPAEGDSLVLEFFHDHPVDSLKNWVKVWSAPGTTLNEFFAQNGTYFKRVMIPVTDTAYLKSGFRFRFYNIASIRFLNAPSHQSNRDHWHVDYVYLDHSRSINDIYYRDIAFANKPGSLLKTYQAMPYRQYKQNFVNEMRDSLRVRITNLNNTSTTGSYRYVVNTSGGSHLQTYETATFSFQPYSQSGYVSQVAVARPPVNFVFPVTNDLQASYNITHILRSHDGYSQGSNDTVRYRQVFADYFAYDDGTAEAGFGLTNAGLMATRFKLNTPDTLTQARIFFNRTLNNANQKYFHLQIWNDFGGKPGELIYEQLFLRVEYNDGLNWFYTYFLDEPVFIDNTRFPGLTFYVGLEQTTSDLLNIGFDRNNNSKENIFYFYGDDWFNTMYDGSLMIRPVMGSTGILGAPAVSAGKIPLYVFPNPVNDGILNLRMEEEWHSNSYYQILSLTGTTLLEGIATSRIDVSILPSGMYLLRLTNGEKNGFTRFVVNR